MWRMGERTRGEGCRVMLRHCLAIIVRKEGCQGDPGDFWMYESGYLLFQGLLSANSVCWWNNALNGATKSLVYKGYVSPGALLVGSEPCALEVLRGAWARRVLQPPAGYQIVGLEDIEDCRVSSVAQTQWTPLPEAVCSVVLRLSSQARPAGLETIREGLMIAFPHVSPPSERVLYDTLAQLTAERKLYQTSSGYFIVTPEKQRRSRSHSRSRRRAEEPESSPKGLLMSTEEALALVHGDMATIRDGDVTHQCIQTNLADVICGGNASDKIMFARSNKRRSASFPAPHSPDRRGSFRFWGSARRLRRSASTRTIARHCNTTDSSSSTEYTNEPSVIPKKGSLLSRIFRRSKRSQCQIHTFSAQFPPLEWFNSKAVHLHSVSTQTSAAEKESALSIPYYFENNSEMSSSRSATLPRRHRRQPSNDSSYVTSYGDSREQSPTIRYGYSNASLPRNRRSPLSKSNETSRKTSRSSLSAPKPANSSANDVSTKEEKRSSEESLKTSHCEEAASRETSGPSSIESHKSKSSSGPSSLESHKTVIKKSLSGVKQKKTTKRRETATATKPAISHSNSFTLQVTTSQNGNSTVTNGPNTKIFVQNSPIRSVITFENGQQDTNPNLVIINGAETNNDKVPTKNTNVNNTDTKTTESPKNEPMNNRKFSLQLPPKENLNYKNLIKNMPSSSHNQFMSNSNPDSPIANSFREFTKNSSFEGISASAKNISVEKNILGSEPNICYNEKNGEHHFPSLSDLSFNFSSLAAQKILKGVSSINSIDTLVELNMAANEKQNNFDVVHTDFGLV